MTDTHGSGNALGVHQPRGQGNAVERIHGWPKTLEIDNMVYDLARIAMDWGAEVSVIAEVVLHPDGKMSIKRQWHDKPAYAELEELIDP